MQIFTGESSAANPAVSATDLLSPSMFPNASFGMSVTSVQDGSTARVITTGGDFLINKASDTIECKQTISKSRSVSLLRFASGTLTSLVLTSQTSGAAIFTGGGTKLKINCDSLLMISPGVSGNITAELNFVPAYHNEYSGNHNFFDVYGGISFFEHGKHPDSQFYTSPLKVVWPWTAGDVFWAGVSPPRTYPWESSYNDRVVFQGSSQDRYMYPSDLTINRFKNYGGNILYLHNETMWEHWQLSLVPRDMNEYLRTMRSAHEFGAKTLVYASPHFFLKGSELESSANPDPAYGPGLFSGSNEAIYLQQAARIVNEFETDGLYFDEMYPSREALATQYHLTRSSRELVGDSGILCYHCTTDCLGNGHFGPTCPSMYTWFNIVFKGEGEWDNTEPNYVRYVLSTYNTSNAIGVQIIDERVPISSEKLSFWLNKANLRFFLPEWFFYNGQIELYRNYYWPRLTSSLFGEIEADLMHSALAYYRFEEPTTASIATDSSGHSNNGTLMGAAIRNTAVPVNSIPQTSAANAKSLSLSGSVGTCVGMGTNSAFDLGSNDFTLEAWIYPVGVDSSGESCIAGKWITSLTGDTGYELMFHTGNIVDFRLRDIDGADSKVLSSSAITLNTWHHVAGVRRGNAITLFIDGLQGGTVSWSGTMNLVNTNQPFLIGAGRTISDNMFTGKIDEVRLTKRALLATQFLNAPPASLLQCGDAGYLTGDVNGDCYLNFVDLAQLSTNWLKCTDPANALCW